MLPSSVKEVMRFPQLNSAISKLLFSVHTLIGYYQLEGCSRGLQGLLVKEPALGLDLVAWGFVQSGLENLKIQEFDIKVTHSNSLHTYLIRLL